MELSGLGQSSRWPVVTTALERPDAAELVVALTHDLASSSSDARLTPEQGRQLTILVSAVLEASGPELTGHEAIQKALIGLSQLQQTLQDTRLQLSQHTATLAPLLQGLVDDLPPNLRWLLAEPITRPRSQRQTSECCPRCGTPLHRTPSGEVVCRVCSAA
jgi:hypothetical protein